MSSEESNYSQQDVFLVPVEALRRGESPRLAGENEDHIEFFTQTEMPLPPILVHRRTMRVIDGNHRLRAAERRGQVTIAVRFFEGDDERAFIEAVRANQAHGLPMSLADREAAATRILQSSPQRSDRAVAAITGLAPGTVAAIRRRTAVGDVDGVARVGRDGRVRPLNSAEGRRMASEQIARRPEATLREIARSAGISLATARDVRERVRRGDDPVPAKMRRGGEPVGDDRAPAPVRRMPREPQSSQSPAAAGCTCADGCAEPVQDQTGLLRSLSRDPSLRFSESGRMMLRWLYARAAGPAGWEEAMSGLPPHCGYLVAKAARNCGAQWLEFASIVERKLGSTA
ncbi:ParB N-terminal domain-containing protein [Micromonospora sp. KC213]|uniref:ParB/RepB/Spo0J family partition protein n=1 Tax=Micromonospora sp. KC213 TaxID=2530378 RepID=UPI00104DC004|nr:ParB N-terminal domain-containing protein [Micromonospora sp. KC213]TDC44256.1 streptomycin biosynthesis protein [Micromonospora sp. KC213]